MYIAVNKVPSYYSFLFWTSTSVVTIVTTATSNFCISSKSLVTVATRPCEIFTSKPENSLLQMPQDYFSNLSKSLVTNATRPCEIFSGNLKIHCHKCHKIFFQTSKNLLSQLPQDFSNISNQSWKVIATNATRFFSKSIKTSCHNCHKIGECLLPQG